MSKEIIISEKYSRSYVSREMAVKVAEGFDCRFIIMKTESGRYMPVLVGHDAIASGAVNTNLVCILT